MQEAKRVFEQSVGRLRAELAGDKEAALSALRRETDEELQVGDYLRTRVVLRMYRTATLEGCFVFLYYRDGKVHCYDGASLRAAEGLKVKRRSQERLEA